MSRSRSELQRVLAEHGVRPSKALGQNFVVDANTIERVVRLAELQAGGTVVEVGAGLGALTVALADAGARVIAVEIDRRLAAALRTSLSGRDVEVLGADAVRLDWPEVLEGRVSPVSLVANLPYSVATQVLLGALEAAPRIERFLVMVQREVGERWVASPRDAAYGAVSVKIAYWATASVVGRVPATVFVPRPKVESVLVRLQRRPVPAVDPAAVSYQRFEAVVRAGFAHRRKMLRRGLSSLVEPAAFAEAGVAPSARAEELDVAAWGRLARVGS